MLEKINELLKEKAPLIVEALQSPATEEQLQKLEAATGQKLPQGLIELYRENNGIDPKKNANFVYGIPFIPIENCILQVEENEKNAKHYTLKYADKGIKKEYLLSNKRIPIGDASGVCLLCVDIDPDEGGVIGQVIMVDTENQIAIKLNESVEQCMDSFEKDLIKNKYQLQEDALDDGVHWLKPEREIDPVNWFNSPRWQYVKDREG